MSDSVIDEVLQKAGGRQALQNSLHVSKQTLSDWRRWGHVSGKRAPAVEKLTGLPVERIAPQCKWVRVPDPEWPNPAGRPILDPASEEVPFNTEPPKKPRVRIVGQLAQQPAAKQMLEQAAADDELSRSIDNSSKG
jgi:hypothetical protein